MTWETDLEVAIAHAQVSMKPILVYFYAPDCLPCESMKTFILQGRILAAVLSDFECVEIDTVKRPELVDSAKVRVLPSFLILEPHGKIRGRFEGRITAKELRHALISILISDKVIKDIDLVIERLKTGTASADEWRKAMLALQDKSVRQQIKEIAHDLSASDRKALVGCLSDDMLAVRLGALEILEDRAQTISGLDPWTSLESDDQKRALKHWRSWEGDENSRFTPTEVFTPERFAQYLQDLIAAGQNEGTRERARYALRTLADGGQVVADWLAEYLQANPDLDEHALSKIREVQYALVIPVSKCDDPLAVAHNLIWGNQDVQVRAIRQLVDYGSVVAPILVDLLHHPQAIVREAATESLFATAGQAAIGPIRGHLKRENDPDILFLILKHLGKIESDQSLAILETYFAHANEDLAICAIEGATRISEKGLALKLLPLLEDGRWRVRAAALQNIREKGDRETGFFDLLFGRKTVSGKISQAVFKCLSDPDEFVRHTAVVAIDEMRLPNAEGPLKTAYQKYPEMRGLVMSALLRLGTKVPPEYIEGLFGPDAKDLLFVLDRLEYLTDNSRPLIHRAAESRNPDVTGMALRIVAASENRRPKDNALLVNALRNGSTELRLTILQELDMDDDAQKRMRKTIQKDALPSLDKKDVSEATTEEVLRAMADLCDDPAAAPVVATEAMLSLCEFGHPGAFQKASLQWPDLTPTERARVANTFPYFGKEAFALFAKALADQDAKVWKRAVRKVFYDEESLFLEPLLESMLDPTSHLQPATIWPMGFAAVCTRNPTKLIPFAQRVLETAPGQPRDLVILALTVYTCAGQMPSAESTILALTEDEDPFIRRAAWITFLLAKKDGLTDLFENIVDDDSKYVREVMPAMMFQTRYSLEVDLYFSEDEWFTGYEAIHIFNRQESGFEEVRPLDEKAQGILEEMVAKDTSPLIRLRCMLALLSHSIPLDLSDVLRASREVNNPRLVGSLVTNLFEQHGHKLGKSFALLLPLLEVSENNYQGKWAARQFRRRWRLKSQNQKPTTISFTSVAKRETLSETMATFETR